MPTALAGLSVRERRRLCGMFEHEPMIAEAWALKEAFRSIYRTPDGHEAERHVSGFYRYATTAVTLREFTANAGFVP